MAEHARLLRIARGLGHALAQMPITLAMISWVLLVIRQAIERQPAAQLLIHRDKD